MGNRISGHRAAFAAMMLVGGSALSGCASTVADLPLIGLPADAPARPKEARAFLPVNDVPQDREAKMTAAEQQKIQPT